MPGLELENKYHLTSFMLNNPVQDHYLFPASFKCQVAFQATPETSYLLHSLKTVPALYTAAEQGTGTLHLHLLLPTPSTGAKRTENRKAAYKDGKQKSSIFSFSWKFICFVIKPITSEKTYSFSAAQAVSQRVPYHQVSPSPSVERGCHLLALILFHVVVKSAVSIISRAAPIQAAVGRPMEFSRILPI